MAFNTRRRKRKAAKGSFASLSDSEKSSSTGDSSDQRERLVLEEHEYRSISASELKNVLAEHRIWLETNQLKGRKADLYGVNLHYADLSGTILTNADLSRAILSQANLSKTIFQNTNLSGVNFRGADLSQAFLPNANLSGITLQNANLSGSYLQNVNLSGSYLKYANLSGAILRDANLQDSILQQANFDQQEVAEEKEFEQCLPQTDLMGANFHNADLSDAKLSTVTGLLTGTLAGANLSNAKLPPDIAKFEGLAHVAETSKNAATIFFGLLGACLYSWLTIGTTTDLALIINSANTPLPIINTPIPIAGFYYAAPLIVLAVYLYFHLYLERLWIGLATLPAVFPDGKALDEKAYPWLLNGLVRAHFKLLRVDQRPMSRIENIVTVFLAWWTVPLTLLAFWLRYIPRHDWWGTGIHAGLSVFAVGFGINSYQTAVRTLRGEMQPEPVNKEDVPFKVWFLRSIKSYHPDKWTMSAAIALLIFSRSASYVPFLAIGSWELDLAQSVFSQFGYRTHANLAEADISSKPEGWTGRDDKSAEEIALVKGIDLRRKDLRHAVMEKAFLVKMLFEEAHLQNANFQNADLRASNFGRANLQDANLWAANLQNANFGRANLKGASLEQANLRDANLRVANLQDVSLLHADLTGAILSHANLRDADLRYAKLRGADLQYANFLGADLRDADLWDANLQDAQSLTQDQLIGACGNDDTKLPPDLAVARCINDSEI
jgi:uncharacterized protein YjbI with pentapeptide repeats